MENSIEVFLAAQKSKLAKDKNRLDFHSPRSESSSSRNSSARTRVIVHKNEQNSSSEKCAVENEGVMDDINDSRKFAYAKSMDFTTPGENDPNPKSKSNICITPNPIPEKDSDPFELYDDLINRNNSESQYLSQSTNLMNKNDKNKKNERQTRSLDRADFDIDSARTKDVMEQWVSDTFYSYFPSFNQYNKKREELARDRHIEYQNYLKKIANTEPKKKANLQRQTEIVNSKQNDIIENEIKDNNAIDVNGSPEYSDNSARPGSARHKLLEDLKHTDLINIINTDAIDKRNRRSAENEVKRKFEYQRDLMRQIEEKRREVELIREKEKREEELLTKKLEEQLKTMKLEEELEKETIKSEKIRIASEQNQILRAHLLSKLETENTRYTPYTTRQTQSENGKDINEQNQNKVYKYFSNSARHQNYNTKFRQNFLESNESDSSQHELDIPLLDSEQEELSPKRCKSYHPNGTICTFCNSELKIFDNYCSKCKTRISEDIDNYYKCCENCKDRFYICSDCEKRYIPCILCHKRRNLCYECMRNLCINCHRPAKDHPIPLSNTFSDITTASTDADRNSSIKTKPKAKKSFKVLDLDNYDEEIRHDNKNKERINLPEALIKKKLPYSMNYNDENRNDNKNKMQSPDILTKKRPPYSMNYDDNFIFRPDNKVIEPKFDIFLRNDETSFDKSNDDKRASMEMIKHKTNDRLSRYIKNYGDLRLKNSNMSRISPNKVNVENVYLSIPRSSSLHNKEQQPSKIPISKSIGVNEQLINNNSNSSSKLPSNKWKTTEKQPTKLYNNYESFTQVGVIRKQLEERLKNNDTV